jgi:hypothetical protein
VHTRNVPVFVLAAVFDGHSKGSGRFFNHSLFRVAGPSWSNVFPSS